MKIMKGGLNLGLVNNQEYFIKIFAKYICHLIKVTLPLITEIREVDKRSIFAGHTDPPKEPTGIRIGSKSML
jgi:hypothetical protein